VFVCFIIIESISKGGGAYSRIPSITSSGYDDWFRSVDWDFSIFPIFRVAGARLALHASPPRIVELGTKKFVFGNLHKNVESLKQKKNQKIFVLMSCEGSENLK